MQVDYLIIGQGICGTLLSWFLHKEGKSFHVIDEWKENSSSRVAAGIINPVTGRRYVYSWMIEDVMPFAIQTYQEMGKFLGYKIVFEKSIIDFFPSPQMRNSFIERLDENDSYLHPFPDQNRFNQFFNYDFGCGEVRPAYIIDLHSLLSGWRNILSGKAGLTEERFDEENLEVQKDRIIYEDIIASKILFCDGIDSMSRSWFGLLPFAPNKGEALIIESEELTTGHIFKKGLLLAPLPTPNQYWVGSNYQWDFENERTSDQFYKHAGSVLNGWLKKPYRIIEHKAAVRPATIERRPFVGLHPQMGSIGILNGMGTKGTSLGPYFANQLCQHLVHGLPIAPEADVKRFRRILDRG